MNKNLKEINHLIDLSNEMIDETRKNGVIYTSNTIYHEYKKSVYSFCMKHKLNDDNYAPYTILCKYYGSNARFYPTEVNAIKEVLLFLKHSILANNYEKIFISHREKDKAQVDAFVELLHVIGIPRTTIDAPESVIFCTSHPEGYIQNGEPNLEKIRNMLNTDEHVFYILWYTDRYFESPACLNEAGAIWAMKKKYQEILMPDFDSSKIRGLLDKQPVWFRANDKMRLNTFKEQIEKMFDLSPITQNVWEVARDKFIQAIQVVS